MSVTMQLLLAMLMQLVITMMDLTCVNVLTDMMEMERTAQVRVLHSFDICILGYHIPYCVKIINIYC